MTAPTLLLRPPAANHVAPTPRPLPVGARQDGVSGAELAQRDLVEARQYGAHAAQLSENIGRAWEELAPLLRAGWASYHDGSCAERHDWRLSAGGLWQGWRELRGASRHRLDER